MNAPLTAQPKIKWLISIISIVVPIVVAILFYAPKIDVGSKLTFLPAFNALINFTCSVLLILALIAIKQGNRKKHERLMTTTIALSGLFLVSYVIYHATSEPTPFGGTGFIKYFYYFILITHVVLAAAILPLVLITYVRALSEKFDKHKKIAKITWPLWLYVTLTGVLVYLMISPYY
jgi:putative membrane protein